MVAGRIAISADADSREETGRLDHGRGRLRPQAPRRRGHPNFDAHWSPDGKKVVFVLDILQGTDGKLQIDTINSDGTDQKNIIPHKAFEESPR